MDQEKVLQLLADAKYDFDHGAFNNLKQAEFFKAMEEAAAEEPEAGE